MNDSSNDNPVIKVGLIGAGRWGPNVIGALRRIKDAELNHVADLNISALEMLSSRFQDLEISTNADELIESDSLDAIAVCTPVETHLDFVEKALRPGSQIYDEKPIGQEAQR